jgi:subtilisin family serine protease
VKTPCTAPSQVDCLVDPANYPIGTYNKNTDDQTYNVIPVPRVSSALLKIYAAWDIAAGDSWNVYFQAGPTMTDPFAGGGTKLADTTITGASSGSIFKWLEFNVGACLGTNCSVGFQIKSSSTGAAAKGVRIDNVFISSLLLDITSYNKINGTSMASPMVAGVVAMVRAHNPLYTQEDVVTAIKESGATATSLANKTTTGKAVDAARALAFILPPTGLTAKVE